METYFENTHILDENMMIEIHKKQMLIMKLFAIYGLLVIVDLVVIFCISLFSNVIEVDVLLRAVPFVLLVLLASSMPKIVARRGMKMLLVASNGDPIVQQRQFGERIVSHTPNSVRTFDYAQIKKVYSLKSCYALVFAQNSAVIVLSRDGFTKGTFSEFKHFLRTKRPDLKIPE